MKTIKKSNILHALLKSALLVAISVILTRFFSVVVPIAGLPSLRVGFGVIPIMISGIFFGPSLGFLTGVVADLIGVLVHPVGPYFPGFTLSSGLFGLLTGLFFQIFHLHKRKLNFNIVNAVMVLGLSLLFLNVIPMNFTGEEGLNLVKILVVIGVLLLAIIYAVVPFLISHYIEKPRENPPMQMGSATVVTVKEPRQSLKKRATIGFDKIAFVVMVIYLTVQLSLNTYWLTIMYGKGFMVYLPGRLLAGLVVVPIDTLLIYYIMKAIWNREVNDEKVE